MINTPNNISFLKAAIITGCFFMFGCSNDFQTVRDLGKKKTAKDEAYNVEAYMSEGGIIKAKLNSPLMITFSVDTQRMVFPKSLHVEFYNDSSKVESRLFAKYAVNYVNTGMVFMRDSVVVNNITGDTLHTPELWWDRNKQTFYTDKYVHLIRPGEDIEGTGLTSDQAFKDIHILHPKGPVNLPDSTLPSH